jgi:hypothetical protein
MASIAKTVLPQPLLADATLALLSGKDRFFSLGYFNLLKPTGYVMHQQV